MIVRWQVPFGRATCLLAVATFAASPALAHADEGGVGFWLPGQLSSFAATPGKPGFSLPIVYYRASVDAGGEKKFVTGGNLLAGTDAKADLVFFVPTYTFAQPLAGGQGDVSMAWAAG